jgi:prephenate dehydrogenase
VIERLAIVGVGLLGGSVAKAVRARGAAREIVGIGRDLTRLQPAVNDGAVDRATTDLAEGVAGADVVVLGATVLANDGLLPAVWAAVPAGACITDVGSTKRSIVREAERLAAERGNVQFVGSHPMAGAEKSGYGVARADLFERATVVVTPTKRSVDPAIGLVRDLWGTLGARVVVWDAEVHDRAVAAISHLPHVVAWALMDAVQRYEPAALDIVAGGFRDTTRIAASDPAVWREILLANRDEVAVGLGAFREALADLERLIALAEPSGLEAYLARVKAMRDAVR